MKMKTKKPFYADFLLTPKCNLKCGFCSANSNISKKNTSILSLTRIEKLFMEFDDLEMLRVSLEGGEPFLRRDISEILQMAGNKDFSCYVNSNGTLITKEMAKTIKKSNIEKMCISIDGPSSTIHDSSRGVAGTFEKATNAIKHLKDFDIDVDAIFTLTKTNYKYLLETMNYLKTIGVNKMAVMLLASVGSAVKSIDQHMLDFFSWQQVLVEMTELKKRGELPLDLSFVPAGEGKCPWELYLPLKRAGLGDDINQWINPDVFNTLSGESFGCTAARDNFAIDGEGNVFGCSLMVSQNELCAGNVNETTLKDIWFNSPIFTMMREAKLKDIKGSCKSCDHLSHCKGGCRACAFGVSGDFLESDYRCILVGDKNEN